MTMMHHPNMHHQPMTGHPSQHLPGHQGMPTHHQHQIPPHQMHRENRHVTLTRVPLGPTQAGGGLGAHTGMGAGMVPHHAPAHRPPHPIRPMPHHPQPQHHSMPPHQMKPLRRPFGAYGPGGSVMRPPYAPPHMQHPPATQPAHVVTTVNNSTVSANTSPPSAATGTGAGGAGAGVGDGARAGADVEAGTGAGAAAGDGEAARPAAAQANSKEKTPMCLVNELARYNKIKHQYRLTSETGPAHKKIFTVTLRLGDTEEYTAEGSSIKRAQHAAAAAALAGTRYPPPPLRAPPAHSGAHPHHRHNGTVMPTVELNALAMKLCQPAVYTSIPPTVGTGVRGPRPRAPPPPYRVPAPYGPHAHPHAPPYVGVGAALVYRVRVAVGGRAWLGEGDTPQAARHDAAARALRDLRLPPPPAPATASAVLPPGAACADGADAALQGEAGEAGAAGADPLSSELKSPVSLVHELALKRNLSVLFTVKSERGPPHMRVFVTSCAVGDMETEGEGNGKKVSKRRAAERMLEEMRRRWPPAALRPRAAAERRRLQPAKKKPRNLIKEGGGGGGGVAGGGEGEGGADNPISRLAMLRHAVRARSPQYRVLEERGAARRREFVVQCDAPPHRATGLGPNKKTAKRRAAHNVLLAMELSPGAEGAPPSIPAAPSTPATGLPDAGTGNSLDAKRKDNESAAVSGGGAGSGCGGGGDVRQPVPGVLLMDYHQCSGQPPPPNGVSESSATGAAGAGPGPAGGAGGAGGSSPGAKDQLMYLAQLLGFTVQFSDFPKRNHGEYLSLVSLSTEPPVMCHGGGPSTAHSHEQCAAAALRALALMGLDAPPHPAPAPPTPASAGMPPNMTTTNKTNVISNGISE